MLRSDEAHISAEIMLIIAIAQSASVCKLVCVKESNIVREKVRERM